MAERNESAELRDAALELIRAIYDAGRKEYRGKIIRFSLRGEVDGDLGDWEIIVQPTRIPAGKEGAIDISDLN